VATRLARIFAIDLPVAEVFQATDLAALAQRLDDLVIEGRGAERPPIEADPSRDRAPLSFGQERLWIIQRLDPANTAYNLPLLLDVQGALAPQVLAATLVAIERRHNLLRSVFPATAGRPLQHIQPTAWRPLPLLDLSALPAPRREAETRRRIAEETATPFDLADGPVWRRLLLRRTPEDHTLVLNFHHLVADGWSMDVLMREVLELYRTTVEGERPRLPPLALQYADYASWQRSWLRGDVLAQELARWQQSLRGAPPLDLPTDRPRPAVRSFRGAQATCRLGAEATQALESLATGRQATLFMVILTACQILLARHAGQRDVVVGFPVAGRSHVDLEALIGFFVNLLPLRTCLQRRETLQEILARTRQAILEAHTRQDVPFEELVKALEMDGDPSRPPLVQAAFTLQKDFGAVGHLPAATVRLRDSAASTAKLELTLFATRTEEGLELLAEYSTDLFDGTTIKRLLRTFCHLLAGLPHCLDRPWEEWPTLTAVHRHQVLTEWSGESRVHREAWTVPRLLAHQAAQIPDAVALQGVALQGAALQDASEGLTFRQLDSSARRLGAQLREHGVGRESVVALCLAPSPLLVVAALAVWRAGGAYLPLDPSHPPSRLLETLIDSHTLVILSQIPLAPRLAGASAPVWRLDGPEAARWTSSASPPQPSPIEHGPQDLAYVIYTSGSTGRPKGVAVAHGGLANLVASQGKQYGLSRQDHASQIAALAFDATVWEIWPPLAAGACLHFAPAAARVDPEALRRWFIDRRITLGFAATPMAEAMLSEPWDEPSALRILFTAGDRLRMSKPPGLDFEFINLYGPTENSVMATGDTVGEEILGLPSIGRPIVGVRTLIVDPTNDQPVPPGVGGELLLGGHSLARGYLGRPALTAAAFIPDPWSPEAGARRYRTGDLVRHHADGRLDFLGRIDHQVKIRGVRVELGEVEARLRSLPHVREAVVNPYQLQTGSSQLVAYVLPEPELELTDLRGTLRELLPDAMVPTLFIALDTLPLTPNGKVDRRALPPPLATDLDDGSTGAAPRNEVEMALASLWQEVLERPRVFIHDDFFDLGGHSVLAVRLMARIEERFGRKVPMATLFKARTVATLAALLQRQDTPMPRRILVPIQGSALPPSRAVPPALVAVHPVGGNVLCYQELAHHLGTERAFFGLQAPPLDAAVDAAVDVAVDPETGAQTTVEEQATRYLEVLGDLPQTEQPPVLIGWSTGGWIAFEMARQLRQRGLPQEGHPGPLVVLIDSAPPKPSAPEESEGGLRLAFLRDLLGGTLPPGLDLEPLVALPTKEALAELLKLLTETEAETNLPNLATATEVDRLLGLYGIFQQNAQAFFNYRPRPYDGPVALFLTAGNSAGVSAPLWRRLAPGHLEIHEIQGDHYSILQRPDVQALAEQLRATIDEAP
jgi:amino acid adenylation domain-containing protein